jgi:signal transduction histidine kinase
MPEPRFEAVDVNRLMRSVIDLYAALLERIEVKMDPAGGLPTVQADPDLMRRALANLVKNAVEAMPGGGTLTIRTNRIGEDPRSEHGYVRVDIADTGPGIPDEIRERIFSPYFTTKAGGSGIGLALAYRIIEDHGGRIGFETGPEGTTFTVDLRVMQDEKPPLTAPDDTPDSRSAPTEEEL